MIPRPDRGRAAPHVYLLQLRGVPERQRSTRESPRVLPSVRQRARLLGEAHPVAWSPTRGAVWSRGAVADAAECRHLHPAASTQTQV